MNNHYSKNSKAKILIISFIIIIFLFIIFYYGKYKAKVIETDVIPIQTEEEKIEVKNPSNIIKKSFISEQNGTKFASHLTAIPSDNEKIFLSSNGEIKFLDQIDSNNQEMTYSKVNRDLEPLSSEDYLRREGYLSEDGKIPVIITLHIGPYVTETTQLSLLARLSLAIRNFINFFKSDETGIKPLAITPSIRKGRTLTNVEKEEFKESFEKAKSDVLSLVEETPVKGIGIMEERKTVRDLPFIESIAVKVNYDKLKALSKSEAVKKIYLDRKVQILLNDSVPIIRVPDLWNLIDVNGNHINGTGINISIIDTGIDKTHPDLDDLDDNPSTNDPKVTKEKCFCSGYFFWTDCCPNGKATDDSAIDDNGHGTHCAGIAAGTGNASSGKFKGVAPGANLWAVKVLNYDGYGLTSDIIAGIQWTMDPNDDGDYSDHTNVISMSLGGYPEDPDDPLSKAVDSAVDVGVVVVVAAGNCGPQGSFSCPVLGDYSISTPGTAKKIITVGASDKYDSIAGFSSRGPTVDFRIKPDVVAPGVNICSAKANFANIGTKNCENDQYIRLSGTSMATPHVAGTVALLKQAHPDWTPEMVKSALMLTAKDLNLNVWTQGTGRVDVFNASNTSIVTYPASINFGLVKENSFSEILTIQNLRSSHIDLTFDVSNASDTEGNNFDIATINVSTTTLQASENLTVNLTIESSLDLEGEFYGYIIIKDSYQNYRVPFLFVKKTLLSVYVTNETNETITYPTDFILVHNDDLSYREFYDYGDHHTFVVPAGNYSVYAMYNGITLISYTDYEKHTPFMLYKKVEVPKLSHKSVILSLSEVNKSSIQAEDFRGRNLWLYETGLVLLIQNQSGTSFGADTENIGFPFVGNQTIYISNFSTDTINRSFGIAYQGAYNTYCNQTQMFCQDPEAFIMESISDEEFFIAWIFKDFSGAKNLTYSISNLNVYNYTYNYPAYEPDEFYLWKDFMPSIASAWFSIAFYPYSFSPPLNKTLYVDKYQRYNQELWFVNNDCYMAEEHKILNPSPIYNYSFGSPPYEATSFNVSGGKFSFSDLVSFSDWALKKGQIVIPGHFLECEDPQIQIFNSSGLIYNSTDFDLWGNLNYYLPGTDFYIVNLTLPVGYPVWEKVIITAGFNNSDVNIHIPEIHDLVILPYFEYNKSLNISLRAYSDLSEVNIFYRKVYNNIDSDWIVLPLSNSSSNYNSSLTISDKSVTAIDLKISISDSKSNQINYTIVPVSLRGRNLNFNLVANKSYGLRGDTIYIRGLCKDDVNLNCSGLKLEYLVNGSHYGYDVTRFGNPFLEITKGIFGTNWIIPSDYKYGPVNFSVDFKGTGIYLPKKETITLYVAKSLVNLFINFTDASGKPVNVSFTTEKIFNATNVNNVQSEFPEGVWDFAINFSNAEIKLTKINISQDFTTKVILDDVPLAGQVPPEHSRYVDILAINTTLNFTQAFLSYSYDDTDVNESNLVLYKCNSWNLTSKTCTSGRVGINFTNDKISNTLYWNTTNFSAFYVTEMLPHCGDSVCQGDETCSSCPQDCGGCPTTTVATTTVTRTTTQGGGSGNVTTTTSTSTTSVRTTTVTIITSTRPLTTTTTVICSSKGDTCMSDYDCCQGYCCNDICSDNACEEDKGFKTYYIIIAVVVVSASVISCLYFTKFFGKIFSKKTETFASEGTISLRGAIDDLKMRGYDVTEIEGELNLAKNALRAGLKNVARHHIENVKRQLQDLR